MDDEMDKVADASTTVKVDQTEQAEQTAAKQLIYCGPSLPFSYGLRQYQVFIGGIPAHVKEAVDKCPAIKSLFVPVDELAPVRLALAIKGSAEAALYNQIQQAFLKGGAK